MARIPRGCPHSAAWNSRVAVLRGVHHSMHASSPFAKNATTPRALPAAYAVEYANANFPNSSDRATISTSCSATEVSLRGAAEPAGALR